jgi:hypothetical protein
VVEANPFTHFSSSAGVVNAKEYRPPRHDLRVVRVCKNDVTVLERPGVPY